MTKHTGAVLSNMNIENAFNAVYYYFTSLGFNVTGQSKPTKMNLERGSKWYGDCWRNKYCQIQLNLSSKDESTFIKCEYNLWWGMYEGKKDVENADMEIEGLKNYLENLHLERSEKQSDRICVDCKKDIPWDATLCPYCGKKYNETLRKKDTKKIQKHENDNVIEKTIKIASSSKDNHCPQCGEKFEESDKYCTECGNKL